MSESNLRGKEKREQAAKRYFADPWHNESPFGIVLSIEGHEQERENTLNVLLDLYKASSTEQKEYELDAWRKRLHEMNEKIAELQDLL